MGLYCNKKYFKSRHSRMYRLIKITTGDRLRYFVSYWRYSVFVKPIEITIEFLQYFESYQGLDKEWPSLEALITHLTVMPEMLPCPLRLPPTANPTSSHQHHNHQTSNPTFTEDDDERPAGQGTAIGPEEEDDEEYQRLSDFSSMLADMQPTSAAPHLFRSTLFH